MAINAIEVMHTCHVVLTVTIASQGHSGGLRLSALATWDLLPGSDLPQAVETKRTWPNARNETISGLAYAIVIELDYAIGRAYEQMSMVK